MGKALYKSAKKGVGALLSVFRFNHERVSTSCLQQLDALEASSWTSITDNGTTSGFEVESWWHTTLYSNHVPIYSVARSAHWISYICLHKAAFGEVLHKFSSDMHSA